MNARKTLNQLTYLEFINFEDDDSDWVELFHIPLKQFHKIGSEPTYIKPIDDNDYISWFESSLDFLKQKKEWLIWVPNCILPVRANVRVLNFIKALEELWEVSKYDMIIADKSTGSIAEISKEEKNYEIYVSRCDITNIDKKNI